MGIKVTRLQALYSQPQILSWVSGSLAVKRQKCIYAKRIKDGSEYLILDAISFHTTLHDLQTGRLTLTHLRSYTCIYITYTRRSNPFNMQAHAIFSAKQIPPFY